MLDTGLFYLFETLGQISVGDCYRKAVNEAAYGEELGFDAVCPAEHHFGEHYGIMPQTEMFLSWVAGRTRKMRLWPMVMVAPLHDPIRLAERVAMLDQFSAGRTVFSVGSGYRKYEFSGFGTDIADATDRLNESIEICVKAWTEKKVEYEGKHFTVPPVSVFPRPHQTPHPPVYVTTARDDKVTAAAERGYNVLPAAGFSPYEIEHVYALHKEVSLANGHPEQAVRPFFKWIYVDEDEKRAREVAQNYFMRTILAFAHGGQHLLGALTKKIQSTWPADKALDEYDAADLSFDKMTEPSHTPLAYGTPEQVLEMLGPCVDAGANYFIGGFNMGVMPPEMVRSSMKPYAEKVMPKLGA